MLFADLINKTHTSFKSGGKERSHNYESENLYFGCYEKFRIQENSNTMTHFEIERDITYFLDY